MATNEEVLPGVARTFPMAPIARADGLLRDGRFAEAVALFDAILLDDPLNAAAFHNRGYALERLGRLNEALGNYTRSIVLQPQLPEGYCNRGNTLFGLKRLEEAVAQYDAALALRPDYTAALNNKANALTSLKRAEEALPCLYRALALDPDYVEAHSNLGFALQKLGRHQEALASIDRALALQPDYADAHNNRGHSLHKLRRFDEARASFERAIELRPDYADAVWNRGLVRLLLGDMPAGWHDLEWRWRRADYQRIRVPRDSRPWRGENLRGRSITVFVEQGFGDMIQFSRYLRLLLESGADVTFAAPRVIHRLMSSLSPRLKLQHSVIQETASDYYCTLFSLPTVFGTRVETIPNAVPYLRAEPELVDRWRARIGSHGFRVAVSWQGNPAGDVDFGRSIPLAALAPLATIPNLRLISIQYEHGLEQLSALPPGMSVEVLEGFNAGPDGFLDTAAVMQCVDLVLTTDSSPAHLAGALNVPVWTMLMEVADWRWLRDRTDNPWYPSMRLFRQPSAGDWASVVAEVRSALIERMR